MNNPENSTWPSSAPIGGMMMSSTKDKMIFPKAVPIMTPTAKSTTFPRIANSLNSFSTVFRLCFSIKASDSPRRFPDFPEGSLLRGLYKRQTGNQGRGEGARFVLLFRPIDQDGTDNAPQHKQSTRNCEQRPHPRKRHARHDQHQDSQEHERKPARPVLPAQPRLAPFVEGAQPPQHQIHP